RPLPARTVRAGIAGLHLYAPPLPVGEQSPAWTIGRVGPWTYACGPSPRRMVPPGACDNIDRLYRRVPDNRDVAIARAVFFDMRQRGERVVEPLNPQLFHHQHVVDLASRSLSLRTILIIEGVPIGMTYEQEWHM